MAWISGLIQTTAAKLKYCVDCGKPLIEEWTGFYHGDTGEKQIQLVCPDKPCEHSGHHWGIYTGPNKWFNQPKAECKRCGTYYYSRDQEP